MRVLLVSSYELGHQPLHVASPAAALLAAGHDVHCWDLAVQPWAEGGEEVLDWAEVVGFSVPMHTAMRLALPAAQAMRARRPGVPICLYGLYAPVSQDMTVGAVADRVIAGEYEPALVAWVNGVAEAGGRGLAAGGGGPAAAGRGRDAAAVGGPAGGGPVSVELGRSAFNVPARHLLPPLQRYARLLVGEERRLVGYVEATHGCSHRCGHCPVPVVYDGRTRTVEESVVLADVEQLVASGARHLTFGDPDFLNRPAHAIRVARAVHDAFPELTFDATVKVTHILRHESVWSELARLGCLFVVSAFECVDETTLVRLAKGHTGADAARAVDLLREHGIEIRPSFLPFTPWTTLSQVADLVGFVAAHDLVPNVDPVHYSIRLLIPDGSLLLRRADLAPHLDGYDAGALSWAWHNPDPRVDALQAELAGIAEEAALTGEGVCDTFGRVCEAVGTAAGRSLQPAAPGGESRARLSEAWFCCAEPTSGQFGALRNG
ncbi:MAG: CUAEP/CCAEP-tail radical SAM (seleno)protein [Acidimicrobiales bacterium]